MTLKSYKCNIRHKEEKQIDSCISGKIFYSGNRWKRREVLELEEVDDCRMDSSVCRGGVQYCRGKRGRIQGRKISKKQKRQKKEERISRESEQLAEGFREIYEEERGRGEKDTLAFQQQIIQAIGEQGYAAVDTDNQINMVHPGQVQDFCESAEQGEEDSVVFFCVTDEAAGSAMIWRPGWQHRCDGIFCGGRTTTRRSIIIMNLKRPHGIIRTRDICFLKIPEKG